MTQGDKQPITTMSRDQVITLT